MSDRVVYIRPHVRLPGAVFTHLIADESTVTRCGAFRGEQLGPHPSSLPATCPACLAARDAESLNRGPA